MPGGALLVPLTAGSVALAYNLPDVSGDLELSREAYVGIFLGTDHETGTIRGSRGRIRA